MREDEESKQMRELIERNSQLAKIVKLYQFNIEALSKALNVSYMIDSQIEANLAHYANGQAARADTKDLSLH